MPDCRLLIDRPVQPSGPLQLFADQGGIEARPALRPGGQFENAGQEIALVVGTADRGQGIGCIGSDLLIAELAQRQRNEKLQEILIPQRRSVQDPRPGIEGKHLVAPVKGALQRGRLIHAGESYWSGREHSIPACDCPLSTTFLTALSRMHSQVSKSRHPVELKIRFADHLSIRNIPSLDFRLIQISIRNISGLNLHILKK
jgi:hypothetical protein